MKLRITVHGVAYEVDVEVLDPGEGFSPERPLPPVASRSTPRSSPATPAAASPPTVERASAPAGSGSVASPIAGTVVEVRCKVGDQVTKDQPLLVIDAMKMNTTIASPLAGKVAKVNVAAGDSVRENQPLVEIE